MSILFRNLAEKTQLQTRNVILQFDEVISLVDSSNGILDLTSDLIKNLHRLAIQDIYDCAGNFRTEAVQIGGTAHQPPPWNDVAGLIDEMCLHVNGHNAHTPIYSSAYLMWRLNWIHPFLGGNGRTARAVSYLALSIKLGFRLPGAATIPMQIMINRQPYYAALDQADAAWQRGLIDVSQMESLIGTMLYRQLGFMLPRSSKP